MQVTRYFGRITRRFCDNTTRLFIDTLSWLKQRPTVPLSSSGVAKAKTYDSGTSMMAHAPLSRSGGGDILSQCELDSLVSSMIGPEPTSHVSRGVVETASGREAGDQFEFTIKTPVTLPRRQSAMLPLVEGAVEAEKMLVFSPEKMKPYDKHPAIAAKITNNTGMKLPAGAITVYDGGTYAGDSLIAFFAEDEKRIISFGEDMTVTGSLTWDSGQEYCAVQIKSGIMKVDTKLIKTTKYRFHNASQETKALTVEHEILEGATLTKPVDFKEKTHDSYRFEIALPTGETLFDVVETKQLSHTTRILNKSDQEIERHISSAYLPTKVREQFKQAMKLKQVVNDQQEKAVNLKTRIDQLCKEQDRIRKNLEVAGSQTQQGQNYLARLAQQDAEIDEAQRAIVLAEQSAKEAEYIYQKYVYELHFN